MSQGLLLSLAHNKVYVFYLQNRFPVFLLCFYNCQWPSLGTGCLSLNYYNHLNLAFSEFLCPPQWALVQVRSSPHMVTWKQSAGCYTFWLVCFVLFLADTVWACCGLFASWSISTEKYHLNSFQLLPSNCRAARCSSFILSLSSFFLSISAISSAGTITGAASAKGGDLPGRAMKHL